MRGIIKQVVNSVGVPINARLKQEGSKVTVQFYDARKSEESLGMFLAEYYLSTLKGCDGGLNLYTSSDSWFITKENMVDVLKHIENMLGTEAYKAIEIDRW